jgi:DNA-binding transcriptional ArsR family regulator
MELPRMVPQGTLGPAEEPVSDEPPLTERVIADVETLKALSDPLRLRIVEAMVTRVDEPWTVKELSTLLGVPQTRLYHHIDLLLERDLIRPVERRVVSGIIETRYRIAQLSLKLDRKLFSADSREQAAVMHDVLRTVFDRSREEIESAIRLGAIDTLDDARPERKLLLSKGLVRLRAGRAAKLRQDLMDLIETAEREDDADDDPAERLPFGSLLALYPFIQEPDAGDASDAADPTDPIDPS